MNLSIIEQMVIKGDLSSIAMRYLLDCRGECEWLDFKEILHVRNNAESCAFVKDILALKNVGGGYIIVGVQDRTWKPVGLSQQLPYDTKGLRDQVRRVSGVDLDVDIVHHNLSINNSDKLFALIFVRSSKKRQRRKVPTVSAKDFCPKESFGIRQGDIFARNGDSTIRIKSQAELERLLEDLEVQTDSDALKAKEKPSPFAIEDDTYRLLERGFEQFIGRENLRMQVMHAITKDPRIWIINVHGPGGVGKTALVNWIVYEFYNQRKFESIIHLTAKETILTVSGIRKYIGRNLYSIEDLLDQILQVFEEKTDVSLDEKKERTCRCLSSWNTLIVLDNMETVSDGRILSFIQNLPIDTKAKILLTSRRKTGSWELPVPVMELSEPEVVEYVRVKSEEMNVDFPLDDDIIKRVTEVSGGLPLAIQWMIGQYKIRKSIDDVLTSLSSRDSPVLEFSFRNIWEILSKDAQAILAVLTVFEEPPTLDKLIIATDWELDRIEKSLSELQDTTLITKNTQLSDGRITYIALPITLSFAKHQLEMMEDFERTTRQRVQQFTDQMQLHQTEMGQFVTIFDRYHLETDNEKRAAILCRRGESELFSGNVENAAISFRQARELAPMSSYVLAISGSFESARGKISRALDYANEACRRAKGKQEGALSYTILARILDSQDDRNGRARALEKALEYDPENNIIKHQYGVALSRCGREHLAIDQFTKIIDLELQKHPRTDTLLMSLKTRIINYKRLNKRELAEADYDLALQVIKESPHLKQFLTQFTNLI